MTEPERVKRIIEILSTDFVCVVEDIDNDIRINGIHPTGKTLFIDALIRPKEGNGWKNGVNTVFGIEFKKDHESYGEKVRHIVQAIDYSKSTWYYKNKQYKGIPILLSPCPFNNSKDKESIGYFIHRFLGQYNIGTINEIQYTDVFRDKKEGISITMSSARIWDSHSGVTRNALSNNFEIKVGSR